MSKNRFSQTDVLRLGEGPEEWNDWAKAHPGAPVNFRSYVSDDNMNFDTLVFPGYADFKNAEFRHRATFKHCVFRKLNFPGAVHNSTKKVFGEISFEGAVFLDTASFDNRNFKNKTSFKDCTFYRAPTFHNSDLHQDTDFSGAKFLDFQSDGAERAYRTLKLAMSKHHAHAEEMMFFRLEMQARRYKTRGPSKTLYWIYEICSDYGQSIMRPLIGLGCIFVVFTIVYWLAKYGGKPFPNWEAASSLLAFTFSRTLPVVIPAMPKLALEFDAIGPLAEAILIGLQSLMSGALLFLLALGIRNRFRLKG